MTKETTINYSKFDKIFEIHKYASDSQLGEVISQGGKQFTFYVGKLSNVQRIYTITEQELLSIVEALGDSRNILLGKSIQAFTDYENLFHESELKSSQRVMRWRLLLEEYRPEIEYIKGP